MNKKSLMALYGALPVTLQNSAVSVKGALNRRIRYGGVFYSALAEAESRLRLSPEELTLYQSRQLSGFLNFAKERSPLFCKRLGTFSQADLANDPFGCLAQIPVLEKDDIRQNNDQLRAVPEKQIAHRSRTSGTTGKPLQAGFTKNDMQRRFAFLYRMLGEFNLTTKSRNVRFSGGTFFPNADKNKIFWRMNYPQRQAFLSSYHLHEQNAVAYIEFLQRFQPEFIDGYPSALYLLSMHLIKAGLQGTIETKVFMSTGETLEDFQKEAIQEAFPKLTILNQYASAEGAPFITQNRAGELVVNTDSGVFEFVKPGTTLPAAPGEVAEMLVTSFTTHAYPLIRYRIGDTVVVTDRVSKSWNMPLVDAIYGRRDDLVWTPYRGWVGRLSPALKVGSSRLSEAQVVQTAVDHFELRVSVPEGGELTNEISPVVSALQERLGPVEVEVVVHNNPLPRGANGKLRAVIALPPHQLPPEASL